MDTTVRINLLLVVLVAFICGFIVKEAFFTKSPRPEHVPVLEQSDYGKSLADKVLALAPDDGQDTEIIHVEHSPVPAENRLFVPKASDDAAQSFTKTNRGFWMALPLGFTSDTTNNYLIYREELPITKELRKYLDDIHGNFVLDVVPFSVFADFNRIFVMMFRTKDKYGEYSTMPWSIAVTDLDKQAVYILENKSFTGNFVHELSHIYFDGFFKPALAPLWMSEGFAVRMQSAAQTPEENAWIKREEDVFKTGEYITFNQFISADDLSNYSKQDALTWYAQAFSVINHLLTHKTRDEFYQFTKNLKDGMPLERAMFRAYGMPFNTVNALEYAWQADLQKDLPRQPQPQASPGAQ